MDELEQLKESYFEDCRELLGDLEGNLNALADDAGAGGALDAAFRAIHSIKGNGGIFGFRRLVAFAHAFETVLARLRAGRLQADPPVVALLLRAGDVLTDLLRAAETQQELPEGYESATLAALEAESGQAAAKTEPATARPTAPKRPRSADRAKAAPKRHYRIAFSPPADLLKQGNEPQPLVRELRKLGALTVTADLAALPALADLDPVRTYLRWSFDLKTDHEASAIRELFAFAAGEADLAIEDLAPADAATPAPAKAPAERSAEPAGAGDAVAVVSSIRVQLDKMDKLVNLVGELVISQSMLAERLKSVAGGRSPELRRSVEDLAQHARNLQEGIMAMRAQPVKSVFARMPRLVRELAAETGKKLNLQISGEDTEIDKTVIEQLYDPITHMIRNAIDHGIEMPDERVAQGKPAEGLIRLSAGHAGGRIVIQVADDGRGIDRQRLLRRAVERNLVAGDSLTDEQIDNLIFLPGLSTASGVSNISGRGVGMDVVRRNVERLGGRVTIRSVPGTGCSFHLALPLTLAVLDGMVVRVGSEMYVVPLANIVESLRPAARQVHALVGVGDVLSVRGAYVPLLHLDRQFGIRDAAGDPTRGLVMLVDTDAGSQIGLVVDDIIGQQQVVIKSLETNFRSIRGIAAATILGNGRVALILDVSSLSQGMSAPARLEPAVVGSAHLPAAAGGTPFTPEEYR